LKKAAATEASFDDKLGDCIVCNQCVSVCPTGIDIREGPQIGCITCALCIDACDKVMDQIGRPRGLIDYATLEDAVIEKAGGTAPPVLKTLLRPRTIIYLTIWAAIGAAMLFTLGQRTRLDISVQHDRNPAFVQLSDGEVRNNYTVKIRNMETRPRVVSLSISGLPGAVAWNETGSRASAATTLHVPVPADSVTKVRLFVAAPGAGPQRSPLTISAQFDASRARVGRSEGDSVVANFERAKAIDGDD
ncbi:MAG TPA: FixG Ig-like domain-containing protein, partial [Polymorphobacter sp.]|nr:FixG Ig-like domain-containing protein [Polymorphobacter sp.]